MNKATEAVEITSPPPDAFLSEQGILAKIKTTSYTLQPSGKTMVCEIVLENGFSVIGTNSVVYPENFNHDLGERFSFQAAVEKIWELEGYLFQERLHQKTLQNDAVKVVSSIINKEEP